MTQHYNDTDPGATAGLIAMATVALAGLGIVIALARRLRLVAR